MTRLDLTSTASPLPMMKVVHRPPDIRPRLRRLTRKETRDWVRKHLGRCIIGFHPMSEDQLAKSLVLIDEVFP